MQAPEFPTVAGKAVSLVSKDAVWDGKLACTGDVRVEGRLEGEVETAGTLYVAAEARVHGTVRARSVMLAGEIEGQLRCEERLEILPGGSARGEIDTGSLVVHEGAFIESKFQMRREGTPARG
jgi:cytoskeletal protein CcmA (bactofilin family)